MQTSKRIMRLEKLKTYASRLLTWRHINVIMKISIQAGIKACISALKGRIMRTKFRFHEQLEKYIEKNYIAAENLVEKMPSPGAFNAQPMMCAAQAPVEPKKNTFSVFGNAFSGGRAKKACQKRENKDEAHGLHNYSICAQSEPLEAYEEAYEEPDDYEIFTGESELEKRMQHISDSFGKYMMYLVEAKGKTSTEVQNGAWIARKVYSKINTNQDTYHPDKRTAFQICVGLGLNKDETKDLIRRAGYDFSPSEKEDVIWSFFFEREPVDYDIFDISDALEKYGLKPIVVLKSGYEKV